ncbi:cardiolipin synthase [Acidimangrovimonas sediminis]|uniref:cardiolipin synthase n=1 Tax=Acidimangrovimonas sediminis TaxID=2056283 RepID=UPI000C7F8F57|nr:cardiolipin synthase [Acidimangrovimonas sediminis]
MDALVYAFTHTTLVVVILAAFQVAAVYFAFRAVKTARTPQGAVGWVVFLFAAPHFAVPAFLFFGHARYPGYIRTRRAMAGIIAALRHDGEEELPALPDPEAAAIAQRLGAFERLVGIPAARGNATRLLIDGDATFAAMFEAIDAAQDYILMQFYTIRDDEIGRAMGERLIERAEAGVKVRVLYDSIGSSSLSSSYISRLREAGVDIRNFHAIRHTRNRLQVNFRNHRKILVIDGATGFIGGHNLGDEYLGRDPKLGHWRDTHLRLDGPAVAQLQLAFAEDWLWSSGEKLALEWRPDEVPEDRRVLILSTGPADKFETGSLYFANAIGAARSRVWIATPYFVPDGDILTALKLAAMRGVDVRILLPERPDHLLVWHAGLAYFDEVRAAGVKVMQYGKAQGFLHQKVVLVDEDFAVVGSHNLDNRSCRLNFEASALVYDADFAAEVAQMLSRDMDLAHAVDTPLAKMGFWRSNFALAARVFAPVL